MKSLLSARVLLLGLIVWAGAGCAQLGQTPDTRSKFVKMIERPRVPLAPVVKPEQAEAGQTQVHFTYAADAQNTVPGLLVKPANVSGRLPVVIVMHGTGGTKQEMLPHLRTLAAKGFIGVAIDGRYHGERSKSGGRGSDEYQDAILAAWKDPSANSEHPFFYDTVWDIMRLIDYLDTRDDVDAKRIGAIGFSKGGIELYLAAAVDKRIAVAVPCIGVQSFEWALENNDLWKNRIETIPKAFAAAAKDAGVEPPNAAFTRKFYDKIVPGIYGEFDGPAMLPLIAPRPLLVINGDSDARTPLPGLKLCTDAAQQAYHAAGADDHFVIRIQERTGHRVNPDSQQAAVDWFVKWLKPQANPS